MEVSQEYPNSFDDVLFVDGVSLKIWLFTFNNNNNANNTDGISLLTVRLIIGH